MSAIKEKNGIKYPVFSLLVELYSQPKSYSYHYHIYNNTNTEFYTFLFVVLEGQRDASSVQAKASKVIEGSYSNVLELSKVTSVSKIRCLVKCMQTFGCVFYNYNKKLSACDFADPLGGSVNDKTEHLAHWSLYKLETLSINGDDEFSLFRNI